MHAALRIAARVRALRGHWGALACAVAACAHPAPRGASVAAASDAASALAHLGAPGLRAMSATQLEANTKYLSSDALEGRGTGARGGALAEQYVADQLAKLGFEPAGEDGTYFQAVHVREAVLRPESSSLELAVGSFHTRLAQGKDVLVRPFARDADARVEGKLVFAGFGISRPDLGYDDLAGVDVRGAIAIVYGGAPRTIAGKPVPSTLHAVLADNTVRSRVLRDRGARAVVLVYDPVRAATTPFEKFASVVPPSTMAWLERGEPSSGVVLPAAFTTEATLAAVIGARSGGPALKEVWAKLDRGEPAPVDLDASASLHVASEIRDLTARNVVGILHGNGATPLAREAVVYTAHLDHLGIGKPVNGDAIYNGAVDDAVGVAGVLEIGRAFAALKPRPARSIVCLLVTGEEHGLIGSDYYAQHPTIPIDDIVADINIDSLSLEAEATDMIVLGEEHSTLHEHALLAAEATGRLLSPDPEPEGGYFTRSDQYSFVKRGVPSVFPAAGDRDAHGDTAKNRAITEAWAEAHYHQPSDEWLPEFSAAQATREAGFDFLLGLSVATTRERPRWNPGDVFEKR